MSKAPESDGEFHPRPEKVATEITPDEVEAFLERVELKVQSRDLEGFCATVSEAQTKKILSKLADTPRFMSGIETLLSSVDVCDEKATALAIAEIGRLHDSLGAKADFLRDVASGLLSQQMPPHFSFGNEKQRLYVAKGWRFSGHPLNMDVVAKTAVMEETSERVCRVWLRMLVSATTPSLTFDHIAKALRELSATRESGDRRSRRLRRLLRLLRMELDDDQVRTDAGIAVALQNLVVAGSSNVSRPKKYADAAKSVDELAALAVHLISKRIRLVGSPAIYDAVARASRWLPDGGWLRITRSSGQLRSLRATLIEGLVILVKQGVRPTDLLSAHRRLSVNADTARHELRQVAAGERDLSSDIRSWLQSAGSDRVPANLVQFSEGDDSAIAMALLAANAVPPIEDSIATDAVDALLGRVSAVARRRGLSSFGVAGDIVEYSPHAHKLMGDKSSSTVRVVEPGVEYKGTLASRVVVPAIVEPWN